MDSFRDNKEQVLIDRLSGVLVGSAVEFLLERSVRPSGFVPLFRYP